MRKSILHIIFFLFGIVFSVYSQNVDTILTNYSSSLLKDTNYRVDLVYKIYKGHSSTSPSDVKKGFFCKKGKDSYTKMDELEILNTSRVHLKINHHEKAILLAKGIELPNNINIDLVELYKYLKADILEETSGYWKIQFSPKGELTQIPFDKLIVELDKKSYRLKRQVFYYYTKFDFSNNIKKQDLEKVKFEVVFSNYKKTSTSSTTSLFKVSNYINLQGQQATVSSRFKGYDIVNLNK